jgi:DNA polymerase-3 subunit delta'
MFEHILGNEPIKAYLQKAVLGNRLAQTLLFTGPDGVGKRLFAEALAAHLLQSNRSPDLHRLAPEGKSGLYAIDTLREMIDKEHAAPFEAPGKVFILEDAERMQPASANALLKTLEEPTPDTTFILLTSAPQEILPTILSRCSELSFQPLTEGEIISLLEAKGFDRRFAKLAHGSAGRAFELAQHPEVEEQRKVLFALLARRPTYPELSLQLTKLEELIEEGKEEDPVRVNRCVEYLFAYILMWHRDQHVRRDGRAELLFFPEEPTREPVPLKEVEKAIETARMAYQRNMKLSLCLSTALLNA